VRISCNNKDTALQSISLYLIIESNSRIFEFIVISCIDIGISYISCALYDDNNPSSKSSHVKDNKLYSFNFLTISFNLKLIQFLIMIGCTFYHLNIIN